VRSFGSELFEYITTIVSYWRVCDEAWLIGSDHLTGIGVSRNYGGQAMVMTWDQDTSCQLSGLRDQLGPFLKRIVVVVDDRETEDIAPVSPVTLPIAVIPRSRRGELAAFIVKDAPD
jgi:hypothetical protein